MKNDDDDADDTDDPAAADDDDGCSCANAGNSHCLLVVEAPTARDYLVPLELPGWPLREAKPTIQ